MLEKPDIPDELITACVQRDYNLHVGALTFLPLGYDMKTAVYRVDAPDNTAYFLKLRRGDFNQIIVALPYFLKNLGIPAIIAPLQTRNGELFSTFEDNSIILYPFIHGRNGYEVRMSDKHWVKLGETLKQVHAATIPPELVPLIPREVYDPQWRESVVNFQGMVDKNVFHDAVAEKLAVFMRSKRYVINNIVKRAEELAQSLQDHPHEFILCHSDAHPGNFLITANGSLYLVDWDNPILAPRERDLMFFGSGMSGDQPGGREERLFFDGYGQVEVNQSALAYYRYERIIQDIAEFCKQLLLTEAGGEDREQAYIYFCSSFDAGSVVEAAFQTDKYLLY